jgi:hypothetical protein
VRRPWLLVDAVSALDQVLEATVDACVQRRVMELRRPLLVHQRNVHVVVGLPPRDFLRLARAGAFPCVRERRLVLAHTEDVVAFLAQRMSISHEETLAPVRETSEAVLLRRVGARRVA